MTDMFSLFDATKKRMLIMHRIYRQNRNSLRTWCHKNARPTISTAKTSCCGASLQWITQYYFLLPFLDLYYLSSKHGTREIAHIHRVDSAKVPKIVLSFEQFHCRSHQFHVVIPPKKVVAIHASCGSIRCPISTTTRVTSAERAIDGTPAGDSNRRRQHLV